MKYCKRCLYPANHPLKLTFNEDGVCSGCQIHEEKDNLDWSSRSQLLQKILCEYKSSTGKSYDCIIPVNGGRDSYYIVHTMKFIYGMNPLLVSYNHHYNTKRGIRNLAHLRTQMNCDLMMMVLAPQTVQKINLYTLQQLGSMYWHCLAGQTVFPVQVAARLKIPLIIWGVHQGCDQVGMFSHLDAVEMTRKYRKEHDLMGLEAEDILNDDASDLTERDLHQLLYPHDKEIEKVGIRGIYLSNYIRWDSKSQHEQMIRIYGYETASLHRTFDTYNDVHCTHYSGLHDYIKFIKHGYGKVTDHASREIRLCRMSRAQGIELVGKYQNQIPSDIEDFCCWMSQYGDREFTMQDLNFLVDSHRGAEVWECDEGGNWLLKDSIINHLNDDEANSACLNQNVEWSDFQITPSRDPNDPESGSVLWIKGYPTTS